MKENDSNLNIFIKRPKLAIVISLAIVFAGIIIMTKLPLEEYPSVTPPQIIVSATYSGASSDVIESTIAAPIEAQLNGTENMIYMTSSSQNGSYKLTLYFDVNSNPDMNLVNVQNELQLVTPRLPEEVRRYGLTVKKSTGGPGILLISMTSPHNSYDNLFIANYSDIYIEDEIARIKGVGEAGVFGSSNYSMRIWLDAEKMSQYKLSVSDIMLAVQEQNAQYPAGDLGVEPMKNKQAIKLTMRTKGRLKTTQEFENIIIKSTTTGSQVKLKDVAKTELGPESYSFFSKINGENAAIISVNQLPEANAIDLSNKIKQKIKDLSKSFPKDLTYNIQHDETKFVRESIKEVVEAVFLAIILVSAVTYLFLGSISAAFIPFCAIPVSLLGVFIFMKIFCFSINLLILFGFVLSVGLVVDDAIVVLENTQRHITEGINAAKATDLTIKEVFGAVVATSLVLMAVFVPVSLLGGITGKMYKQFALCIASSIGLSTLVALTLSPALCSTILKTENKFPKFIHTFNNYFENLKKKYITAVKMYINSPKMTLYVFTGIIILTILVFKIIPGGFLPQEDRGAIFSQVQLTEGSSASETNKIATEIESEILKIKGVKNTITMVGMNGENTAFIVAVLEDWKKRRNKKLSSVSIIHQINTKFKKYPHATVATFSPPAISGLGMFGGFEYQLLDKGNRTPAQFYKEAQKLISELRKNPKFSTIYTSYSANLPQLLLNIDTEKAMAQNISITEIYNAISAYFGKSYINDFNKHGRVYRVYMEGDSEYRENINDLSKIYIKNKSGEMLPLNEVVKTKNITGPYTRTRFNMYPSITINGNARNGVSSGDAIKTAEQISDKILPEDMTYSWSGTTLQEKDASGQILPILIMSVIFVYLFLVGLYESWFLPVSVLMITPVAAAGGLTFQYVFGYDFDIYSQIGLVMLTGLSAKQAILIIEFAKDAHKNGLSITESAIQAASLRFRAVMMTNISFILGLLPLIFATGAGSASRHSVGMTVFGGMVFTATIGIILVPAFFVITEKFKEFLSQNIRREK